MAENTDDNREKLAKEVCDNMTLDDLVAFFECELIEKYQEFDEMFQQDWELYIEDEVPKGSDEAEET